MLRASSLSYVGALNRDHVAAVTDRLLAATQSLCHPRRRLLHPEVATCHHHVLDVDRALGTRDIQDLAEVSMANCGLLLGQLW
jgi:hypothetical protein